jgi:dienelactone hydrolase
MLHRIGRRGLATFTIVLMLCAGVAGARGADIDILIEAFFEASDADQQAAAIEQVVASEIGAGDVARRLRAGRVYSTDVVYGWSIYYNECADGVVRPFHVFIPESYRPSVQVPVLFDLHGAVARKQPYSVESMIPRRALWESTAADEGWILVMPHGDYGATWWNEPGHANLLAQLRFLKRRYNVDENRVFLSGFSDGGSGALWMGFHDPTAWAGFIDIFGHPVIAGYGPYQSYPRNLLNRPIRASNGSRDDLYPAPEIRLYVDQLLDLGVDIDWFVHATGHDYEAVILERPAAVAFVNSVERDPHPTRVIWETSDVVVGRCDWVRIDEIADVGNNLGFKDANVWPLKEEIRFGASFAYQGGDVGFIIAGVEPWTTAHFSGVKTGDKIVRIDEFPVETGYEVPAIIDAKNPGDAIEIEVIRNGETLVLHGQIPAIEPAYSREKMTGSIEATADGNRIDVTVRNVASYTLLVSVDQFDMAEPIVVVTNGVESFSGVVEPDVRFMLEQAARDNDRRAVYEAKIEIVVPRGAP